MSDPRDDTPPASDGPTGAADPVRDGNAEAGPTATGGPTAPRGPTPWPTYPKADPIAALSYIVSGVLVWGLLGWGAARWLDAPVLTGLGLVVGGALGTVLVYLRYGRPQSGQSSEINPAQRPTPRVARPSAEPAPRPEEEQ